LGFFSKDMEGKKGKMVLSSFAKIFLTIAGIVFALIVFSILFGEKLLPVVEFIKLKIAGKI
jgi:hypothetical protein